MRDQTTEKLLELLEPGQPPELRCAAARVLAEVGTRTPALEKALCAGLQDPDPDFRAQAIGAVGRLRVEPALPVLIARVREGGHEAELAARAAARFGAKGVRALKEIMGSVAPGLRRRIAAALGAGETTGAEAAALQALLDPDPGVVDAAARSLVNRIPTLGREQRRVLANRAVDALNDTAALPAAAEAALLRLLVALGDPRAEDAYWRRVEPGQPAEVRAAALQGLGSLPPPRSGTRLRLLRTCAADADFRVAAPSLLLLRSVPVTARSATEWLPLFEAPDPATRRFALEKLGDIDSPDVTRAVLAQLAHPDRALRQAALECLTRHERGRTALANALLEAATPDDAWNLARAQVQLADAHPPALRSRIIQQAARYLEADDRRAEPLLFLLRHADAAGLRDGLEEKALAARKKKQYDKALLYFHVLVRDPACREAIRFESAACALKLSSHDLAPESRSNDPALQQFARMIHRGDPGLVELFTTAKWLDSDDLFYVGFHFVEGDRQEKALGAEVLRLLIRRSSRAKRAVDARRKLRSEGLD